MGQALAGERICLACRLRYLQRLQPVRDAASAAAAAEFCERFDAAARALRAT